MKTEVRQALREILAHMPKVREARWLRLEPMVQVQPDGSFAVGEVYARTDGMKAIVSLDLPSSDTVQWLHVSVSFKDRCPSWDDMCNAKQNLMGDVYAIQMHPPQSEWVNRHPYCLHLWHNVLGTTVPDEGFDRMAGERAVTPR